MVTTNACVHYLGFREDDFKAFLFQNVWYRAAAGLSSCGRSSSPPNALWEETVVLSQLKSHEPRTFPSSELWQESTTSRQSSRLSSPCWWVLAPRHSRGGFEASCKVLVYGRLWSDQIPSMGSKLTPSHRHTEASGKITHRWWEVFVMTSHILKQIH